MGQTVYERYSAAREVYAAASDSIGVDMARVCFGDLVYLQKDTRIAQPAIATVALAEYRSWCDENDRKADLLTGLSKGLYTAVGASGAVEGESLSEKDANTIGLIGKRAVIMHRVAQDNPGSMTAVLGLIRTELANHIPAGVKVAVSRGEQHFVLTGPKAKIRNFQKKMSGIVGERKSRKLPIDMAAHHPYQAATIEPLRNELTQTITNYPDIPILGNSPDPGYLENPEQIIEHLLSQMVEEAQWDWTVKQLAHAGISQVIQFGPDKKRGLMRDASKSINVRTIKFPQETIAV